MLASERLLMNHGEMDPPQLILWLEDAAILQDGHDLIKGKDDWVPGATEFRQHKETVSKCLEVANGMGVKTTKELEEAIEAAVADINTNANYLALRATHEKNDAWLHNNGYQWKEKTQRNYNRIISATALLLKVKNGPNMAEVTLSWDKDPAAGSYQVQMCKGEPQGEHSFVDQGYYTKVRAVIGDLERASWYYFRVRSIGNNEIGPWSEAVGIIVI